MKFLLQYYSVFGGILLGFLIYGLKFLVVVFFHPLQSLFALIGLILIFVTPFLFKYKSIFPIQGIAQNVYYLYLFWTIVIITRPFFEGTGYSANSVHPYAIFGVMSYLLPFFVLLGVGIISLPKLFHIIYIFSLVGLIYFIFNFRNMQAILAEGLMHVPDDSDTIGIVTLASRYGFWFNISVLSLLCYEFLSKTQKWFAILSVAFLLFMSVYFARRGGIVVYLMYGIGAFFLYLQGKKEVTKFLYAVFFLFLIGIVTLTVFMYSDTTFSLLFSRLGENSRDGVDQSLIEYLNKENAWIIGKGIEGAYMAPGFDIARYVHETGYLYMILKGGVVYLGLYCFLLLNSAYLGFFKTNNRLTKAFAIYLFFHILLLIPFGVITFDLEYLMVWFCVAFCQFDEFRFMTNQQIHHYLTITK